MKRILIIGLVLTISATSCIKDLICINGNVMIETQSRNTASFNQIENSTGADVIYRQSDDVSITVVAESNLLGHIVTESVNGNLKIRMDPWNACLDYNERPVITVTSPELKNIVLSGSGNIGINGNGENGHLRISGSGNINSDEFLLNSATETISGSGNIFTYVISSLTAVISGSGNIYLKGDPSINQTVSGSGRIIKY